MHLVALTALGVGGATVLGALIGFVIGKVPHKYNDAILDKAAYETTKLQDGDVVEVVCFMGGGA